MCSANQPPSQPGLDQRSNVVRMPLPLQIGPQPSKRSNSHPESAQRSGSGGAYLSKYDSGEDSCDDVLGEAPALSSQVHPDGWMMTRPGGPALHSRDVAE